MHERRHALSISFINFPVLSEDTMFINLYGLRPLENLCHSILMLGGGTQMKVKVHLCTYKRHALDSEYL